MNKHCLKHMRYFVKTASIFRWHCPACEQEKARKRERDALLSRKIVRLA